ncbi:hypothetical protein [Stenotrophomonas maltophilia]|uniref:hypothetical protein n=1 Tax=Stenotrophomonas maltophilia TaxID=40324 RepID=UPI0039C1EEEA
MFFPSLQDANDAIEPFGMSLTRDGDGVVLDGDSTWRAWRAGSESSHFDTLGHFWGEWCWYVAFALENERKRACFMSALLAVDVEGQVNLLNALSDYEHGRASPLDYLFASSSVTMETIPDDWPDRLAQAIAGEGEGAVLGGGKLFRAIRRHASDAMSIFFPTA